MLKNLDIKLEKEYDEGYQRGIEGSKLKYFGMGLEDRCTTEHVEWVEKGHGNCCFSTSCWILFVLWITELELILVRYKLNAFSFSPSVTPANFSSSLRICDYTWKQVDSPFQKSSMTCLTLSKILVFSSWGHL